MKRALAPAMLAIIGLSGCDARGNGSRGAADTGPTLDQDGDAVIGRGDAAAHEPAQDAGNPPSPAQDAGDAPVNDAALDAAPLLPATCTLEGGVPSPHASCGSELCSMSGATWLLVSSSEWWQVGGLDWVATACDSVLGWPRGRSSDGKQMVFALSDADVASLTTGAPVLVGWGEPQSGPPLQARHCELTDPSTLRACPISPLQ